MTKPDLLIHTAFKLFYEQGIHAVGINTILNETGVAKKTLYHHFSSKEALVEAVLKYRDHIFMDWLTSRMLAAGEGKAAVLAIFDALDDWFHNQVPELLPFKGCFFVKVNGEFHQHRVNELCFEHKQAIVDYLTVRLTERYGEQQAQRLANQLALLKEGAIAQAYLGKDRQAAKLAGDLAEAILLQA